MRNQVAIRERYLRDTLSIRLGGLAANLARIKSFSEHPDHHDVTEGLLEESKFFIEWSTSDAGLDVQTVLVELQIKLAWWQRHWKSILADPFQREAVTEQIHKWSKRVLEMSGLLDQAQDHDIGNKKD